MRGANVYSIMDEFGSLRWMPLQPKHLDYANAQFLLIGESFGKLGSAVEQSEKDEKHGKDKPEEEMEKLEKEDEHRVDPLNGMLILLYEDASTDLCR